MINYTYLVLLFIFFKFGNLIFSKNKKSNKDIKKINPLFENTEIIDNYLESNIEPGKCFNCNCSLTNLKQDFFARDHKWCFECWRKLV